LPLAWETEEREDSSSLEEEEDEAGGRGGPNVGLGGVGLGGVGLGGAIAGAATAVRRVEGEGAVTAAAALLGRLAAVALPPLDWSPAGRLFFLLFFLALAMVGN